MISRFRLVRQEPLKLRIQYFISEKDVLLDRWKRASDTLVVDQTHDDTYWSRLVGGDISLKEVCHNESTARISR